MLLLSILQAVPPEILNVSEGALHVHFRDFVALIGGAIVIGRLMGQIKSSTDKITALEAKIEDKVVLREQHNRLDARLDRVEERTVEAMEKLADKMDTVSVRFVEFGNEIRLMLSGQEARLRVLEALIGAKED